jgi:glycosyltransferase involved in cell wall biosynthesis
MPVTERLYPLPHLSIVVCVYNEAGNNRPLIEQIRQAMPATSYELIYVNDGSTDQTLAELRSVDDPRLVVLDLQKNYGQSLALAAGIDIAQGTYIVTLDGDQQNDPADILRLLHHCEANDLDLVSGLRANRQDGFLLRKVPSRVANALIRWTTGVALRDLGCGLKVIRADLAKNIRLYGELHRFIGVLAQLEGARMAQLPVNHRPRQIGQSKYGLGRTLRVVSDLLLVLFLKKYFRKPMHLFGTAGLLLVGLGTAITTYGAVMRIAHELGTPLIAGLILLVSGLQLLAFGIMAELQMRSYYESGAEKPYRIRRVYHPFKTMERV